MLCNLGFSFFVILRAILSYHHRDAENIHVILGGGGHRRRYGQMLAVVEYWEVRVCKGGLELVCFKLRLHTTS